MSCVYSSRAKFRSLDVSLSASLLALLRLRSLLISLRLCFVFIYVFSFLFFSVCGYAFCIDQHIEEVLSLTHQQQRFL